MLKSAIFTGHIVVKNQFMRRPIVSMDETVRVFQTLLDNERSIQGHHIYNISSFNTSILAVASSIALMTGAKITHTVGVEEMRGFSVDNSLFRQTYNFEYSSTNDSIIRELWQRREELLDSWSNPTAQLECLICRHQHLIQMVDLAEQPLANNFTKQGVIAPRYPLAMYRCPLCHHHQLSHVVHQLISLLITFT